MRINKDKLLEHIAWAEQQISKWPPYLRHVLNASRNPNRSTPRKPVMQLEEGMNRQVKLDTDPDTAWQNFGPVTFKAAAEKFVENYLMHNTNCPACLHVRDEVDPQVVHKFECEARINVVVKNLRGGDA